VLPYDGLHLFKLTKFAGAQVPLSKCLRSGDGAAQPRGMSPKPAAGPPDGGVREIHTCVCGTGGSQTGRP